MCPTMNKREEFLSLALSAIRAEALKKLVFSRPAEGEISKVSCRLVAHRGRRLLALEYSLPGNTVSQKNFNEDNAKEELEGLLSIYRQANLITALGDAEWKISKSSKEVVLGAMEALRETADEIELVLGKEFLPYPIYSEILYSIK